MSVNGHRSRKRATWKTKGHGFMIVNLRHDWKIHSTNSHLVREKKGKMKLQQDTKDNKNNASSSQITADFPGVHPDSFDTHTPKK